VFEAKKLRFNWGENDSMKIMNANYFMRRYWAGGYHFGDDSQFEIFISKEKWQIGWSNKDQQGKLFYERIREVKIGDFFALKALGGKHDLTVSALGIVIDNREIPSGELKIKWIKSGEIYKSKAPKGTGAGNWFGTLLEIKREEDIAQIFKPLFEPNEEDVRILTLDSDAFDFWKSEEEDIYQDFLNLS